jgi:ABC-type Mn2+/Zn2+ transport system ATPase subunit
VIATASLMKRYPRVTALDELTVEVGYGVTGLVGANGTGKSTLLKIFLGLIAPTAGSAIVLGHDVVTGGEAVRALVGYLPETTACRPFQGSSPPRNSRVSGFLLAAVTIIIGLALAISRLRSLTLSSAE